MNSRKENVEKYGSKAKGRRDILKHLSGQRLTNRQAILAKCYDCMGYYADGRIDCKILHCSLHPAMPYKNIKNEG